MDGNKEYLKYFAEQINDFNKLKKYDLENQDFFLSDLEIIVIVILALIAIILGVLCIP